MKEIEFNEECKSCEGTGIYKGLAELKKAGVICHKCEGTGCFRFKHKYTPFKERRERHDIIRVVKCNPGIGIDESSVFGGLPYKDWLRGDKFIKGTEMRKYTCPAWWYQSANYKLKPDWKECWACGAFSSCKKFSSKEECWQKWDKENPGFNG
jgi:hypothetical protein